MECPILGQIFYLIKSESYWGVARKGPSFLNPRLGGLPGLDLSTILEAFPHRSAQSRLFRSALNRGSFLAGFSGTMSGETSPGCGPGKR